MAKQTIPAPALLARPTRALLACGAVVGPVYVAVTAAQALTRDGFDLSRHPFNALTAGDLGWIHRTNLFLAGVLTVLFAVGVGRVLRPGRGARWGPRLLGLYGLGMMIGGVFSSNPVSGFPPGTSPETTWHGMVHVAARGSGYVVLIAASLVIAGRFAAEGLRGWAWFSRAAVAMALGVFPIIIATGVLRSTLNVLFLVPLALTWAWVAALAVHLYRRVERGDRDAVPGAAGRRMRITPEAG